MADVERSRSAAPERPRAVQRLEENLSQVLVGQPHLIRLLVIALIAKGHVLLEDTPGTGKTVMAKAMAKSLDAAFRRIQCTADLLPTDITGVTIYDQHTQKFSFQPGPIFAHLVLADEINRASPRTQSALLEAMAEGQVTTEQGTTLLPDPHFVIATENPVDLQGTYPLPQAQLDRFWLVLAMERLQKKDVRVMLHAREHVDPLDSIKPVATIADLQELQRQCTRTVVAESIGAYLSDVGESIAKHPDVQFGASLRTLLHVQRLAQAAALVAGRRFVNPDDVKLVLKPALAHRISVRPRGPNPASIVDEVLSKTPVPMR